MMVAQNTEARIQLTERIWSRKAEFYYRRVKYIIGGNWCSGDGSTDRMDRIYTEFVRMARCVDAMLLYDNYK